MGTAVSGAEYCKQAQERSAAKVQSSSHWSKNLQVKVLEAEAHEGLRNKWSVGSGVARVSLEKL